MGAAASSAVTMPVATAQVTSDDRKLELLETFSPAEFEGAPFAQGSFRHCYRGKIHHTEVRDRVPGWETAKGNGADVQCVVKVFKDTRAANAGDVREDVASLQVARRLADAFNALKVLDKRVVFAEALVAQVERRAKAGWFLMLGGAQDTRYNVRDYVTLEPFLGDDYVKFSNNAGYVNRNFKLPSAFSHFTFHITKRKMLVCDLQGARQPGQYLMTDPAIHSVDSNFGGADQGALGILLFFATHQCTDACKKFDKPAVPPEVTFLALRMMGIGAFRKNGTSFRFETAELQSDAVQTFATQALEGRVDPQMLAQVSAIADRLGAPAQPPTDVQP